MRVVILTFGSAGDVLPFVAIGRELQGRGHSVELMTNARYREPVVAGGLPFTALGDVDVFETLAADPRLWHPTRGSLYVLSEIVRRLSEAVDGLLERVRDERPDVLVGSSLAFAARIVRDLERVPLVTVHLAPAVLRSVHRPPRLHGAWAPDWSPVWYRRAMWWVADRVIEPVIGPGLRAELARRGLPRIRFPLADWWHSPDRVLGLFPEWFAPPQPDWPAELELVGFPLADGDQLWGLDPELDAWLAAGTPPVVVTPGSANFHAGSMLATAVSAASDLGRRVLVIASDASSVPRPLPDGGLHREWVPFGAVLPRAAALVSHGGIGTVGQAFAAGVPHLVLSFAHDQLDNGSRLEDLGCGAVIPQRRASPQRVAERLVALLGSTDVRSACSRNAGRIDPVAARRAAAGAIEEVARVGWRSAAS
jgi:UDP:flavonoid glycosyltransferase YjiC (YdhE family)